MTERSYKTASSVGVNPHCEALDFGAAWPAARARLAAVLRSRGVQEADVDDVIQEVAIRALGTPRSFDSEEHLVAWCCRVGINLHIDSTRRQRRLSGPPSPETAANEDTAATAERRLALEVLTTGIAELSDEERRLLFELEPALSRREAVRLAVRRHRLRARLAALVEGMAAGVPVVGRLVRLRRSLSAPAKLSLAAAPLVAVGLMLGPLATGGRSPETSDVPPAARVPLLTASPGGAQGAADARTTQPAMLAKPPRLAVLSTVHVAAPTGGLDAAPAGVALRVNRERGAEDHAHLVCTGGLVDACVAQLPGVPEHTTPTLP